MTDQTFADLGVAEPILRALETEGYTQPTPIQKGSIPTLLTGRDLLGLAQTGTGKTAAFSVPILQRLAASGERAKPRTPRALILAPTRELAVQINDSLRLYGSNLPLRSTAVFGGVGIGAQIDTLRRGVDILVATPGRLLDLVSQRAADLGSIEILTLDEADRMLDMGFVRDVRRIVKMVPKARQTLLLSATMPSDIEHLAAEILSNPFRVEVAHAGKTVDRIKQSVHFVSANAKRDLLATLLGDETMSRVMVFTRTKRGADRVAQHLMRSSISAEAIHGNKSQNNRQRTLESFRTGRTRVLVATDIAARGLDIDLVSHVVNFELPHEPEAYVHRIGRTARAGSDGIAIAFCSPDERADLKAIERLTRRTLEVVATPEIIVTTGTADSDTRRDRIEERFEARETASRGEGRPGRKSDSNRTRQSRGRGDRGETGSGHGGGEGRSRSAERGAPRSEGKRDTPREHAAPKRAHSDRAPAERHTAGERSREPVAAAPRGESRTRQQPQRNGQPQNGRSEARPQARNHANGEARSGERGNAHHRGGKPAAGKATGERHAASGAARSAGDARPTRSTTAGGPMPWSSWTSRSGNR